MYRPIKLIDQAHDAFVDARDLLDDFSVDDPGLRVVVDRVGEVLHEIEMVKRTVENYE